MKLDESQESHLHEIQEIMCGISLGVNPKHYRSDERLAKVEPVTGTQVYSSRILKGVK